MCVYVFGRETFLYELSEFVHHISIIVLWMHWNFRINKPVMQCVWTHMYRARQSVCLAARRLARTHTNSTCMYTYMFTCARMWTWAEIVKFAND